MKKIENKGGYGVKGVKTQEGRRGYVFGGKITLNGKEIGTFFDAGEGGMMDVDFKSKEEQLDFLKFLKENHPETTEGHEPFSMFLSMLADEDDDFRKVRRSRNRKTFFFLKSEKTDYDYVLRELSIPYGPQALKYLKDKFKDDIGGIGNEIFDVYPDDYKKD